MGVPTKGESIELSRDVACSGSASSGGVDGAVSSKDRPSVVREIDKQTGKLSRIRRPRRRTKSQHQQQPHKHWHHQKKAILPVADKVVTDPYLQHTPSLPSLVPSGHHPQRDMERNPSRRRGPSTANKDEGSQPPMHGSMDGNGSGYSASGYDISQVPAAPPKEINGESNDFVNDQEQQLIRKGLEDLLARPPPSLDCVAPDKALRPDLNPFLQRKGDIPPSSSLPELFLSRIGHHHGGGSARGDGVPTRDSSGNAALHEGELRGGSNNTARATLKSTATSRRTKKPTRSQSGGLPRPANSGGGATGALSRRRGSAFSAGAGPAKTATAAASSFTGEDAALLEQAFAFAERSAREEEALKKECQTQRRQGTGSDAGVDLQLHPAGKGGRLRRAKSGGGDVAGVGAGGKIEAEDWVRGLTRSSPRTLSQRRHLIDQHSASINQAPAGVEPSEAGGMGAGHQARVGRRGKLAVGLRKKREAEEAGALKFDRRREKEGKARAAATAELVERFESGSGVAALKAELEKSQAAMRRSAEAFEQVASRWHHQRSMLPVPGDR